MRGNNPRNQYTNPKFYFFYYSLFPKHDLHKWCSYLSILKQCERNNIQYIQKNYLQDIYELKICVSMFTKFNQQDNWNLLTLHSQDSLFEDIITAYKNAYNYTCLNDENWKFYYYSVIVLVRRTLHIEKQFKFCIPKTLYPIIYDTYVVSHWTLIDFIVYFICYVTMSMPYNFNI